MLSKQEESEIRQTLCGFCERQWGHATTCPMYHTCIKDDGGTPNRTCDACKAEATVPNEIRCVELPRAATRAANAMIGIGGGPTRATTLPEESALRKQYPLATGLFDYFPDALVAVAHLSWKANEQHNPGQPVHWARGKSTDHDDTLLRHFAQRGTMDTDNIRHRTKVAWRALAALQEEIEAEQKKEIA